MLGIDGAIEMDGPSRYIVNFNPHDMDWVYEQTRVWWEQRAERQLHYIGWMVLHRIKALSDAGDTKAADDLLSKMATVCAKHTGKPREAFYH